MNKLEENVGAIGSMIDFIGGIHYKIKTEMILEGDKLILISSTDRDVYGECMICENENKLFFLFRTGSSRTFVYMVETVVHRVIPEIERGGDYFIINDNLEISKAVCFSIKNEGAKEGEKNE